MNSINHQNFQWVTIDVTSSMPLDWSEQLLRSTKEASLIELTSTSVTSREQPFHQNPSFQNDSTLTLPRFLSVYGTAIARSSAWLIDLYHDEFLGYAKNFYGQDVVCGSELKKSIVLNALQGPAMRYEAHLDSNPITGLLFITSLSPGMGGELVVARNQSACSVAEIEDDCITISPVAGNFLLFNGRDFPHYVRSTNHENICRAAVAFNFYTDKVPESARPSDLDQHLGLLVG